MQLNIGGAINMTSKVFQAPKAGIYHFSFLVEKYGYNFELHTVYIHLNDWQLILIQHETKKPALRIMVFPGLIKEML